MGLWVRVAGAQQVWCLGFKPSSAFDPILLTKSADPSVPTSRLALVCLSFAPLSLNESVYFGGNNQYEEMLKYQGHFIFKAYANLLQYSMQFKSLLYAPYLQFSNISIGF